MSKLKDFWKNIFNNKLMIIMVLCAALCLSACDGVDFSSDEEEKEYKEISHLYFPVNNIRTLNPSVSKDEDTYFISRLLYDGLFRIDGQMIPRRNLAASYHFIKDTNELDISLKSAKFHDGKELKADDVKFSIDAYKAAGDKCRYKSLIDCIEGCDVKSSKDLKIRFKDKGKKSLAMLTFPILPAHKYDSVYSLNNKEGGFEPVGTGQYKFSSFKDKISLELKPNKKYHGVTAENSITFLVTKNSSSAYQLVEAGSLSALITRASDREARVGQKEQKIIDFLGNEAEFIGFNFNREVTLNKDVRKGIALSINTRTLIEDAYQNSGVQNDTFYYAGYLGTKVAGDKYPRSRRKALAKFALAGYTDSNSDGVLENSQGTPINLNILVNDDDKQRKHLAELIKEQLEDVGVNSYITAQNKVTYLESLKNGSFDIFVGGLEYDEVMDLSPFLKGEGEVEQQDQQSSQESNTNSQNGSYYGQQDSIADEDEDLDEEGAEEETDNAQVNESVQKQQVDENKKYLSKKMDNSNYVRYYNSKVNDSLDVLTTGVGLKKKKEAFNTLRTEIADDLPYYCLLQRTYGAVQSPVLEGKMAPVFDNYYYDIGQLKCKYEISPKEENKEEEQ